MIDDTTPMASPEESKELFRKVLGKIAKNGENELDRRVPPSKIARTVRERDQARAQRKLLFTHKQSNGEIPTDRWDMIDWHREKDWEHIRETYKNKPHPRLSRGPTILYKEGW